MRVFGCSKFRRLANEEMDRTLTASEKDFVQRHQAVCSECSESQSQSSLALNFLRASAIEVDVHPMFEERVIRKLKVQTTRESIGYWSPAVAGAFIAGLAVIAALQMITRSADLPHVRFPGEANNRVPVTKTGPALDQLFDIRVPASRSGSTHDRPLSNRVK
jgi:hypothetical protein